MVHPWGDIRRYSGPASRRILVSLCSGGVKVILHSRPDFVLKVPSSVPCSVVLQAFFPPPFQSAVQERLNLLYPVRALSIVHLSGHWHKSEKLFVCFGAHSRGTAASKQSVAHWIEQAISEAYGVRGV